MRLPPTPTQARELAADGLQASRRLFGVVPRLVLLLDAAEDLLGRLDTMTERLAHIETAAQHLLSRIDTTHEAARALIDRTQLAAEQLTEEVDGYLPTIAQLRPVIDRLAETWQTADIDALTEAIRRSPGLIRQATDELLPTVQTLENLAPDLRELLASSRALNEIVGSVPGLNRAKKRIEEKRTGEEDG